MNNYLLKKENYSVSDWSGGKTMELAIFPASSNYKDRNFIWRLSSATVDLEESDFTVLPDHNRVLMVLKGNVVLVYDNKKTVSLAELEQDSFDGAWATKSYGRITDLNLMVKKGSHGALEVIRPEAEAKEYTSPEDMSGSSIAHALYCHEGYFLVDTGSGPQMVRPGETYVIEFDGPIIPYTIMGSGVIIRARIVDGDMEADIHHSGDATDKTAHEERICDEKIADEEHAIDEEKAIIKEKSKDDEKNRQEERTVYVPSINSVHDRTYPDNTVRDKAASNVMESGSSASENQIPKNIQSTRPDEYDAKSNFSEDFKWCIFLANTQFRGAKHIVRKLKGLWYDEELTSKIKSIERLYTTFVVFLLGILCVMAALMNKGISESIVVAGMILWFIVDCLVISPLIYYLAMPKPIASHIKNVEDLTDEEMAIKVRRENTNERVEKLMKKYEKSGRVPVRQREKDDFLE